MALISALHPCQVQLVAAKLDRLVSDGSACNFQSMKSPVELNSLFSKFFCYITWFVISPD